MLKNVLQKSIDTPVKVVVYNSKARETRGNCKQVNVKTLLCFESMDKYISVY